MSLSTPTETCKSKPSTAPTTALTTTPTPTPPQDEKRCAYSSKTCMNPRAVKQNKTLHKLCEFHRRKANLNQLRMQQRRRLQRRQSLGRGDDGTQGPVIKEADGIVALGDEFGTPLAFQDREFSPEELKVLEIMLFDSDESESDFDQGFRRNTRDSAADTGAKQARDFNPAFSSSLRTQQPQPTAKYPASRS